MSLLGPDLRWVVPLVLRGFSQHLPAKYTLRPSYHLSARHLALCHGTEPGTGTVPGTLPGTVPFERKAPALCHVVNLALVVALCS